MAKKKILKYKPTFAQIVLLLFFVPLDILSLLCIIIYGVIQPISTGNNIFIPSIELIACFISFILISFLLIHIFDGMIKINDFILKVIYHLFFITIAAIMIYAGIGNFMLMFTAENTIQAILFFIMFLICMFGGIVIIICIIKNIRRL